MPGKAATTTPITSAPSVGQATKPQPPSLSNIRPDKIISDVLQKDGSGGSKQVSGGGGSSGGGSSDGGSGKLSSGVPG